MKFRYRFLQFSCTEIASSNHTFFSDQPKIISDLLFNSVFVKQFKMLYMIKWSSCNRFQLFIGDLGNRKMIFYCV